MEVNSKAELRGADVAIEHALTVRSFARISHRFLAKPASRGE
jgi:hypothetical protein